LQDEVEARAIEREAAAPGQTWEGMEQWINRVLRKWLGALDGPAFVRHPLYLLAQDRAFVIGIRDGRMAKPDVVDLLGSALAHVRKGLLDLGPNAEATLARLVEDLRQKPGHWKKDAAVEESSGVK
jgi:hypothetical protein